MPDRPSASARFHAIDWARGFAVLIMILAHVIDAWTLPAATASLPFRYLRLLGGFAAPAFLWLAGLSLVLAGERALRRTGDRSTAWRALVHRGLQIFTLAFLFRAHAFVFNPGGAVIHIFRVDILNIMGPSMVLAGLLWGIMRTRPAQIAAFGGCAVAIAMIAPLMRLAAWVDWLPVWLQWYVRPAGEYTVFTLFPWSGFVFAGAAAGVVIAASETVWQEVRVRAIVLASGIGVLCLGLYTSTLPTIYRASSFWSTSPTYFAIRVGMLLIALGLLDIAATWLQRRGLELRALTRLGRSSLLVYWIHVQLAYGWATAPIHRRLTVGQVLVAYVVFVAAMYALIPLRDRLRQLWEAQRRLDREAPSAASV